MSYKNDSNLVIANRFGDASSAAKAQMWETYDRLRDLTVSGSGTGTGFEAAGGLLYNMASLLAPSSFATLFGSSETMNISGTSYYSRTNTGSSYGVDSLYNYSGFPSGAASIGSIYGLATGGASSILNGWGSPTSGRATGYASNVSGLADITSAAAYGIGTGTGLGQGFYFARQRVRYGCRRHRRRCVHGHNYRAHKPDSPTFNKLVDSAYFGRFGYRTRSGGYCFETRLRLCRST